MPKRQSRMERAAVAARDGYSITERMFQQQIVDLAHLCGWMEYHTWLSIRSTAGFPDLVLCRDGRLIFAELKSERGMPTAAQEEWLAALRKVQGVEVYLWRPNQWPEIVETLQREVVRQCR